MTPLFRARKRFGQNFLAHEGSIRRISARAAEIASGTVLEIGPGMGALTASLLSAGLTVGAVEIDRDLAARLKERFAPGRFRLLEDDVLRWGLKGILEELSLPSEGGVTVVGNLPYNISKPVARKMVAEHGDVSGAILMFQKEVALRITASPGDRSYGPLAILAGSFYRVRRWFDLPPAYFRPSPRVTSTVTLWEPLEEPGRSTTRVERLSRCLEICFGSRRRTLRNNLRQGLGCGEEQVQRLLEDAGLEGNLRAEALPVEAFHRLAEGICRMEH